MSGRIPQRGKPYQSRRRGQLYYFRLPDGSIQCYESIIDSVIAALKKGEPNPRQLWKSVDDRFETKGLSFLAQVEPFLWARMPSIGKLLTYTKRLNKE